MEDIIKSEITQQVYKLMLNLSTIRDQVFPSAKYMAEKIGCSVRSVWYAIKALSKEGFIFYFGKADKKSGIWSLTKKKFHISNNYLLHLRIKEFWLRAGRYFQKHPDRFLTLMTLHKRISEDNPMIEEADYQALMLHYFKLPINSFKKKLHKSFLYNSFATHCTRTQDKDKIEDLSPSLVSAPSIGVESKNVQIMKKRFYESHTPEILRHYEWCEKSRNAAGYAMFCLKKRLSVPDALKVFRLALEDCVTWAQKYGKANNALAFFLSRFRDHAKKLFGIENYIITKKRRVPV